MSREIKFRAWNDIDKAMIPFSTLTAQPQLMVDIMRGRVRHHKLEQYTGLKDKNGVEIYEGDVVSGWKYNPERKHIVKFFANKYSCEYAAEELNGKGKVGLWYENLEVIGNIHQNPELLEG